MAVLFYELISAQPLLSILERAHEPDIEPMEIDGSFFVSERRNYFVYLIQSVLKYILYIQGTRQIDPYLKQTNLNMKNKGEKLK